MRVFGLRSSVRRCVEFDLKQYRILTRTTTEEEIMRNYVKIIYHSFLRKLCVYMFRFVLFN